jgi:iron complex outermembrane receptor protein
MKTRYLASSFLAGIGLVISATAAPAAQPAAAEPSGATGDAADQAETIVVTGARDLAGVRQKTDSSTLFGINKPLVDTPRSITDISEQLLSRYNIKTVYDLTAVAAGTYTGSFFGVPGSVAIRGTIADNYFNGFQGIQNYANFPTPVDAASDIEIVRGPPSPIYGSGQVGGFLNFRPKSARGDKTRYVDRVTGYATVTYGSYEQKEGTANIALPVKLGDNDGGLNLYGKIEDSKSFYRGMHPKSQVGQATFTTDIGDKVTFETSYQFIHSDGYLKNIGWNRVTQDLIDNGNYLSGAPLTPIVAPGATSITRARYNALTGGSAVKLYAPAIGSTVVPNPYLALNPATLKTVKLSRRTTFLDPDYDVNEATSHTGYAALKYTFDDDSVLKFESFLNTLDAQNYQSYGFATTFKASVFEERLSYSLDKTLGALRVQAVTGLTYRHSKSHDRGSLNDFVISEDRRDLSVGPTPDDRFNDPNTPGFVWATDERSRIDEYAAFGVFDFTLGRLALTTGGRFDLFDVRSLNRGREVNNVFVERAGSSSPFTYNASLSYKFDFATFYGTYAKARSLQLTQGGGVRSALVPTGAYLGASELKEIGVKSSQLDGRLFISLDAYKQKRSYLATPPTGAVTVSGVHTKGVEGELRYLVTRSLGLTATGSYQVTRQDPTAGSGTFVTLPACLAGIRCDQGYGGYIYTLTNFYGLTNGYRLRSSPKYLGSVFATYDVHGRFGFTGGVTYASQTGGFLPGSINLPSYALAKLGAYAVVGPVRVDLNLDNVFDKRYFIVNSDADANANVLPGIGRTWHVKATYSF